MERKEKIIIATYVVFIVALIIYLIPLIISVVKQEKINDIYFSQNCKVISKTSSRVLASSKTSYVIPATTTYKCKDGILYTR